MEAQELTEVFRRLLDEQESARDALLRLCFERSAAQALQRLCAFDAEDVASRVSLRAFQVIIDRPERAADFVDEPMGFLAWVAVVTRNECADFLRGESRKRRRLARAEARGPAASGLASAELSEWKQRLDASLSRLSADEREILVLRYFHQLPSSEIGALFAAPAPTIRARIQRALKKLKIHLSGVMSL